MPTFEYFRPLLPGMLDRLWQHAQTNPEAAQLHVSGSILSMLMDAAAGDPFRAPLSKGAFDRTMTSFNNAYCDLMDRLGERPFDDAI